MASHAAPLMLLTLALAGLAAPALATFCLGTPGATCWPKATEYNKWKNKLSNTSVIYSPFTNPEFLTVTGATNILKAASPSLVVVPATEADVATTVKFATNNKLKLAIRCSGHDFQGRSTGFGSVQLNMGKLNSVVYDAATQRVTLGGGANWGAVYSTVKNVSRLAVGPNYRTVCASGCLTGGCHSPVSRQFGLGIDSVVSMRVVLYDGSIVTTSATERPALFNALLGAGANTFGVITSITLQTFPAPPKIVRWVASWPLFAPANATDTRSFARNYILNATWIKAMPKTFTAYVTIGAGRANTELLYHGPNLDEDAEAGAFIGPLVALPGFSLTSQTNFTSLGDYADANFNADVWFRRRLLTNVLAPDSQDFLDGVTNLLATNPNATMNLFYTYGGKAAQGTAGSVPPGMRTGLFQMIFGSAWIDPAEDMTRLTAMNTTAQSWFAKAPSSYSNQYVSVGKYSAAADWKTRFFSNYNAIFTVKKQYDPCNVFTAEYAVGADLSHASCSRKYPY